MLTIIGNSLRLKLLTVVTLILIVIFAGTAASMIFLWQGFSTRLARAIDTSISKSGDRSHTLLLDLNTNLDGLLTAMMNQTAQGMKQATTNTLGTSRELFEKGLGALLEDETRIIMGLLKSLAPSIIASGEFKDLVKYSKAASQSDNIVYAFFMDPSGEPYSGHVNTDDPKIRNYLETGQGVSGIQKIITGSRTDPEVTLVTEPIDFYGRPMGKIYLGVSRASIVRENQKLSREFQNLLLDGENQIRKTFAQESTEIIKQIETRIAEFDRQSVQGIAAVRELHTSAIQSQTRAILLRMAILSLGALGICLAALWIIMGRIFGPLAQCAAFAEAVGTGNLKSSIDYQSRDEIGLMAMAMATMAKKLSGIITGLKGTSRTVSESSQILSEISGTLADSSKDMETLSDKTTAKTEKTAETIKNISFSAEEISNQITSIAASSETVSRTMDDIGQRTAVVSNSTRSVAAAIEEMFASLNEVASNSGRCSHVTSNALSLATSSAAIMNELGAAAKNVGNVITVINSIANQTNLLALNAAIEAAGAGDAGKGFAVVANEVKELSRQTSLATQDIRRTIQGMQTDTQRAIEAIEAIVAMSNDVNTFMESIASAVEEQTATTNEIAQSIGKTASTAEDLNRQSDTAVALVKEITVSLDQVSQGSAAIAADVSLASSSTDTVLDYATSTNTVVKQSTRAIETLQAKARDLANLAGELNAITHQFDV
ncbi:MAG: methyl-accepting chemotaxis protein [Pseudomonadota bacterium]